MRNTINYRLLVAWGSTILYFISLFIPMVRYERLEHYSLVVVRQNWTLFEVLSDGPICARDEMINDIYSIFLYASIFAFLLSAVLHHSHRENISLNWLATVLAFVPLFEAYKVSRIDLSTVGGYQIYDLYPGFYMMASALVLSLLGYTIPKRRIVRKPVIKSN